MKRSPRIKKSEPFSLREIRRLVLLPLLLLCGLAGSIYALSFNKVFRQLVTQSSATTQSNGAMSLLSHSNWLLFITLLFLAGGLWLYTWIDYHSHKRPLILEMPSVHYTLKHHLLVVSLPQARYNWRPLAYKSVMVTISTFVLVFSSFISIRHAFAAAPVITTNTPVNVTQTSAKLQGTVGSTGTTDLTVRGFEYGTTTSYGSLTSDTSADTYKFATTWGAAGSGNGQFSGTTGPEGLAKDSAGNIYVLDGGNGRVEKFSAAGVYMSQFGTLGTGFGNFNYPHGISIDGSDNVYIADTSNNRVEKYSTAGTRLDGWGGYSPTPGDSNMYTPGGVAADQDGNIFVADTGHNRIQKFSNTGVFIAKWGTGGSGDGQFNNPYDVDTDPAGNVYVADEGNNRIQKFDNNGNFITQWGSTGTGNSQFTNPQAITVDNYGFVLVMDSHNHRLQKFTSNGNYVAQYGSLGTADGQFQYPVSIFTDSYGGVFVADSGNRRVVKLTPTISTGDYGLTVRDLACNTTYHYRAFSVNASETGYGSDQTFTTTGCYAPNEFVTTWKTDNPGTSASNQITIPTYSGETYNYNVDWGDSSTSTSQTGDATHTYASAGTYTVKITGTFPRIYFNAGGDKQKILTVEQWGTNPWTSMASAFYGASNLTVTAGDAPDLSNVTSTPFMFGDATNLNSDISEWDVSHVTNMSGMFYGAASFNQSLNSWDVSSVTDMGWMFSSAAAFNSRVDYWEVGSVTNMSNMFSFATSFNQPLDSWGTKVSNVSDMSSMFGFATSFNQPLNSWDVSSVTSFSGTFQDATIFNQDISSWDTGSATDMGALFFQATAFNQPLGSWDVSSVTIMQGMFYQATAFNQPLDSWGTKVSNVTDMHGMFWQATSFNQPLNSWDVSSVTRMEIMFSQATSFNQPLNSWDVSSVTTMNSMFSSGASFNQSLGSWDVSNVTNMGAMFSPTSGLSTANYDATLIGWNALTLQNGVTFDAGTSTYCSSATERADIISTHAWTINDSGEDCPADTTSFITTWKTDNIASGSSASNQITIRTTGSGYNYSVDWGDSSTSSGLTGNATHTYASIGTYTVKITGTFPRIITGGCGGDYLKLLTVEQWGANHWTSMASAFECARNLTIPATDSPDLSGVTDMSFMFTGASSLNSDISGWNVSTVTSMWNMFNYATSFNQPLNSWNVGNVTNMGSMFFGTPFNQPLNSWNVGNVTRMDGMFYDATSFNQSLGAWDVSNVTNMNQMFSSISGLSTANYDATLIGWNALTLQNGVTFGAGTSTYCSSAAERANIISTYSWAITDSGENCPADTTSFITTWKTDNPGTSASNQITIPTTGGGYNYDVDWGDGNTSTGQTGDTTHTYASVGTYTVKITGSLPRIYFGGGGDANKILTVQQWGSNPWTSMNNAFYGASNLTVPAADAPDLSGVTDMFGMFAYATNFNSDISSWDVSNVTDIGAMFAGATSFNQPLNNWDVSNVTNMTDMFDASTSFNQPLNNWDVSNVTNMGWMFIGASAFDQDISSWNVSNVTNMINMFNSTIAFNQPLDNWNVSNVTNMDSMFSFASSFNQPLDQWHTDSLSDMAGMFTYSTAFNQPLNTWNVSNVTNMNQVFSNASVFNQPLDNWNVSNVTNMIGMFNNATTFDRSLASWNVSNVTKMAIMFSGVHLSTANYDATLIGWNALTLQNNVTFGAGTSTYCSSAAQRANIISTYAWTINDSGQNCSVDTTSFITTWKTDNPGTSANNQITIPTYQGETYNYDVDWGDSSTSSGQTGNTTHTYASPGTYTVKISGTFPRIYLNFGGDSQKILTVEQWGSTPWTSMANAFSGASNLSIPATDAPNLSAVTDMSYMFCLASNFNSDISSWDVSNVTNMSDMFYWASAFNQPLDNWDVSNVTDMSSMFMFATSFNQPLNSWNVSNVTNMSYIFYATSLNSDISAWDVSNVTNMSDMFGTATSFNSDISSWDVSNVTNMSDMFYWASAFNQPLDSWNTSHVTTMHSMFSLATSFDQSLNPWDVSSVSDMIGMFGGSGLSTTNYDATLIGWNSLTLQNSVTFDAGTSTYCSSATERANIISTYAWTINDSGENCPTIPQTDFSLTKTLTTAGPIQTGNTVTYHFKIKNLGPNNSYYAGAVYDVLPTEFNFVSNTNANVGCADMGLTENAGLPYFADVFPGHHLVVCVPVNNGSDTLAQGASVEFDMVGTATANFTSSSTTNKSLYIDYSGNEDADFATIYNASLNDVDFTTLPINNSSTQTYSYTPPTPQDPTPDPAPTPTYSCDELTALADDNNTQEVAPLDVAFTETATATHTTIQNYLFDFGDGLTASSATPKVTHAFSKPGTYRVRARVQSASGTSGYSAGCSINVTANAANPTGTGTGSSSSSNGGSLAAPQINKKDQLGSTGLEELHAVKGIQFKQKITDLSNTVPYYFTSFLLFLALLYAVQAYREYQRAKAIALLVTRYQQTSQNVQTFLSITSHYLNTPVAIMQSAVELFSSQKILPTSVTSTIYASLKELGAYVATIQQKSQSSLEPISSNVVSGASFYKGYSLLKTKKAWVPLAVIAGVIATLDIVFRLLGAYGNTNIRSLNHLIFYILSGLIMVSSLYFQQRQLQLRDKRQSLLLAEKALQKQKTVLFETASQTLEQYHILLSQKSEEFRSLPKTKVFFNGLAMLNKLCLSLGNVQAFSVVHSDAPAQNLKNTITSALQERASTISQKQLKVHTVMPPSLSIQARPNEAAYLVGSVLDNAVKFSPQNGSINISATTSRSGTTITTTNSGPIIPENKLNELFQPFNRATAAETFDYEGMGLGLFTNKILAEKLGGKLTVQNIKSGGVKVSIFLPKTRDIAQGQVNFIIHPEAAS